MRCGWPKLGSDEPGDMIARQPAWAVRPRQRSCEREGNHESQPDHIVTSHAGSLPRPDALIEANRAHEAGEAIDEERFEQTLRAAVAEVVRRQQELGIDVPGDGEFGKPMAQRVNYGSWWRYSWSRLGGLESRRSQPV